MAIDNSSTLVRRSTKRSSHQNDFTWKNTDKDGALKATGSDVFKDTSCWFTQDLRKEFHVLLRNRSRQPTQSTSDHPTKRYRGSVGDADKQKAALKVLPDCSNTQQVTALYRRIFGRLRQIDCRSIGQAWIGLIAPNKQYTHPYNGGDKRKPKWWPDDVQHSSPHHLGSEDRVTLLIHILRMSGKGKATCDELQKAAAHKIPVKAHEILDEIFAIRESEEEVEEGGDQDGITATGATGEELNHRLIQVSSSASDEGRESSSGGSPKDQIEEISPTSPSVESSPDFATPSSYPSTSEALANPMYSRGCQNQTPYPVSQSPKAFTQYTAHLPLSQLSQVERRLIYMCGDCGPQLWPWNPVVPFTQFRPWVCGLCEYLLKLSGVQQGGSRQDRPIGHRRPKEHHTVQWAKQPERGEESTGGARHSNDSGKHDMLHPGNAKVRLVLHILLVPLLSASQNGSTSGMSITAQKLFHVSKSGDLRLDSASVCLPRIGYQLNIKGCDEVPRQLPVNGVL
ncbi:hypothetical protein CNMCM8980_004879 [Aspergillus fumigatiaffinis]|nr:hypothetical protein CNMCM8980_004879 [Aspergillus fumigatiaffinis]